ncbi:MAG TPA: MBL fold metallo-hydrolase [Thermoplasmatales archaeon]|nr:MBL fold metallo-hydrolase [Thermoplasmatales archaeon]HEX17468.1 MBL fold metallo-hydrolase [Thermoplasmatales archaeon]
MIHPLIGRMFDSNIYVVDGEVVTIIDCGTGLYFDDTMKRLSEIIDTREIDQIVLTHEHVDHSGGAEYFKKRLKKIKILAHERTAELLEKGMEPTAKLFSLPAPRVKVDQKLREGDKLIIGDDIYRVLYTPGHSEGSICLYQEDKGILFSGDTIFSHGGIGRYDLPGGDLSKLERSIERISNLKIRDLYPGHGDYVIGSGDRHVRLSLMNIGRI